MPQRLPCPAADQDRAPSEQAAGNSGVSEAVTMPCCCTGSHAQLRGSSDTNRSAQTATVQIPELNDAPVEA